MTRTLVISIDALLTADIPRLRELPNIGRIMRQASVVKDIFCIYPTLTYPCHATIATGCWPDRHGICNNELFQPLAEKRADWYWFRKDIQVPTVIDHAREAGLKTSTITWPVMGDCGADYNIGEIWAPGEEDDPTPWFARADSPKAADIFEKNKHMLRWMKTPQMDEFAAQCAVDIIRQHRPDLMLLHLSYVDHQRHKLGTHAPGLSDAFAFVDQQIGKVLLALDETGGADNTNIVLLGDHGHLPCDSIFHINSLFRDMGWLTQKDGRVTDYLVYGAQCGFSAQIYLKPGMNEDQVYEKLQSLQEKYPDRIERIFTKEEARDMHLTGDFAFVLEAAQGVTFDKAADAVDYCSSVNEDKSYKPSVSNHGHLPEKGDKPPFIVSGPDVKAGVVIENGRLVDEAPTILRMLGIAADGMDGVPFYELLKEN